MSMLLDYVLPGLLSAFFLFASSIKIFGWQKMIFETQLAFFRKYGLNRAVMAFVGVVELFGALALWLPGKAGQVGLLALLGTSAGAIFFHLRYDTWKDGVPAMVTLALSGFLLFSRYSMPVS